MKKVITCLFIIFSLHGAAADRKELVDIVLDELILDTQKMPEGTADDHVALTWWVPYEYWASMLLRDPNLTDPMKEGMLNILEEFMIVSVVQADISMFGAFDYYSKDYIEESLEVSYRVEGTIERLSPIENVPIEMRTLMGNLGPILETAMGELGANFHFFIYEDINKFGERIVDPYQEGTLTVEFSNSNDQVLRVDYVNPMNSLFVPRVCPSGEDAHISWNYCPWSGEEI